MLLGGGVLLGGGELLGGGDELEESDELWAEVVVVSGLGVVSVLFEGVAVAVVGCALVSSPSSSSSSPPPNQPMATPKPTTAPTMITNPRIQPHRGMPPSSEAGGVSLNPAPACTSMRFFAYT